MIRDVFGWLGLALSVLFLCAIIYIAGREDGKSAGAISTAPVCDPSVDLETALFGIRNRIKAGVEMTDCDLGFINEAISTENAHRQHASFFFDELVACERDEREVHCGTQPGPPSVLASALDDLERCSRL